MDLERPIRLYPHASDAGSIYPRGMGSIIQTVLRVSPSSTLSPYLSEQLYLTITSSSALTPGGWIEQMELDVRVYSDDGTLQEGGTLATWGDNFIGCSERAGRSLLTQETMHAAMEKAGFVDIQEKLYKIPLGPWPKDKVLKEAGQLQYAHWVTALEGWAMWLLTKFGAPTPWTQDEVQVYLSKVRAELRNPRTHAYEYA